MFIKLKMQTSSGRRIKITFGDSARRDISSIGLVDTSSTAPGGASASVPIASPAIEEPHRQGRARGQLVTVSAHRKKMHDMDAGRHLWDEEMGDEQIPGDEQVPRDEQDPLDGDVPGASGTHASASQRKRSR